MCFHWDYLSRARRVSRRQCCRSCPLGDVVLHPLGLEVVPRGREVHHDERVELPLRRGTVATVLRLLRWRYSGSRWRSRWYGSVLFESDDLLDDRRGTRLSR